MALWSYGVYVSGDGVNQPRDWYREQDEAVKAACRDILGLLANRPHWRNHPYYLDMVHEHIGLGEIRIPVGSKGDPAFRRVRFFGVCDPQNRAFTILVSFEKFSDRRTNPADAEALALRLKAEYEQGKGATVEYGFI